MNVRERKGLEIAARMRIVFKDGYWRVPSSTSRTKFYNVIFGPECSCTCEDYELRRQWCKHIYAVKYTLEREHGGEPAVVEEEEPPKPRKPSYKQDWPKYNAGKENEWTHFPVLLYDLCRRLTTPGPSRKGGRPKLPLSDMVFAMALKVYRKKDGRTFDGDLKDAAKNGYIRKAPHWNSVLNYFHEDGMTETLTELIGASAMPLKGVEQDFAFDSTGFSTCRFVRWFDAKYGHEIEQHHWVTAHFSTGVKTNIVTHVEVTEPHVNDSPQFPKLFNATAKRFKIREASADKQYSSVNNLEIVDRAGAIPFIPFKDGTTGASGGVWERMFHFYEYQREEFLRHYHRRSNAESTVMMVKTRFPESLWSKSDLAMKNEVLTKFLVHNICCVIMSMYELGIEAEFGEEKAALA